MNLKDDRVKHGYAADWEPEFDVKIIDRTYSVKDGESSLEASAVGRCCSNTQVIELDTSFKTENLESAFIHESLEAIKYILNYDDEQFSHHVLSQVSVAIYMLMKDNPHVFGYKLPGKVMP